MRVHSGVFDPLLISQALRAAQAAGKVHQHVAFAELELHASRKRKRAYDVQLGSDTCEVLPDSVNRHGRAQKTRRTRNSDVRPDLKWSATWHEWGWFIAVLFDRDPHAVIGQYDGRESFHASTGGQFRG